MNIYPPGQCTYGAAAEASWVLRYGNLGNALDWAASWRERGGFVQMTPAVGAVACFQPGDNEADARFGHVAVVIGVTGRTFVVSEMNGPRGPGHYDDRTCTDDPGVSFLMEATPTATQEKPMHLFAIQDALGTVMLLVEGGAYLHVGTEADVAAFKASGATGPEPLSTETHAVLQARYNPAPPPAA